MGGVSEGGEAVAVDAHLGIVWCLVIMRDSSGARDVGYEGGEECGYVVDVGGFGRPVVGVNVEVVDAS